MADQRPAPPADPAPELQTEQKPEQDTAMEDAPAQGENEDTKMEDAQGEGNQTAGTQNEGNQNEGSQNAGNQESAQNDDTQMEGTQADGTQTQGNASLAISKKDYDTMTEVLKSLSANDASELFQRMINKRVLPDYFEVIKEPVALSSIRAKISKKSYQDWSEFVRDLALICHNAQVYNRPSAPAYALAVEFRDLIKAELAKLVQEDKMPARYAELPYLGELPPVDPSPPPGAEEEEEGDQDEEDDDDEEEEDESDDDRAKRRGKGRPRSSLAAKRDGGKSEEPSKEDPDYQKKRGRPPKVHTPMEARIYNILRGLRKPRNEAGELRILPFEKLPDKTVMPEYYQEIKNAMALDLVKRKAKRKKYQSVEQVMKDIELVFENAKTYNREDSQVYKDAVALQGVGRQLAEEEKKKPDADYADEDGKIPLSEILHNGELWKVGDWVHLQNPNDLTKPIVGQIYRTWQDPEGQKWINACWYYRPEQTVHRVDKHFYENEVVKTGQYRDHKIDEVMDRCFVMFFTRYNKGRPRGFPADKEVYVCEARYNEVQFKLNKIKTWASCVPDEVRDKDYEMDLFDVPRKMKKVPSPIKHLLRHDAKEDDPLPKPTWGADTAPPIVGAVHVRPREANESPPPEPTPSPPPPAPIQPSVRPVTDRRSGSYSLQGGDSASRTPSAVAPSYSQSSYGQQFSRPSPSPAPLRHQSSWGSQTPAQTATMSGTPRYQPISGSSNYAAPSVSAEQFAQSNVAAAYQATPSSSSRAAIPSASLPATERTSTTYTLPQNANDAIPEHWRSNLQCDDQGRVLWFSAPPIDKTPVPESQQNLGHSIEYLAAKKRDEALLEERRKKRDEAAAEDPAEAQRKKNLQLAHEKILRLKKTNALRKNIKLLQEVADNTEQMYKNDWGAERWETAKAIIREEATTRLFEEEVWRLANERIKFELNKMHEEEGEKAKAYATLRANNQPIPEEMKKDFWWFHKEYTPQRVLDAQAKERASGVEGEEAEKEMQREALRVHVNAESKSIEVSKELHAQEMEMERQKGRDFRELMAKVDAGDFD